MNQQMLDMISVIADAERHAGTLVKIDYTLPSIEISRDGESVYYFQEWQASELLDKVPDGFKAEDFILFSQSSW